MDNLARSVASIPDDIVDAFNEAAPDFVVDDAKTSISRGGELMLVWALEAGSFCTLMIPACVGAERVYRCNTWLYRLPAEPGHEWHPIDGFLPGSELPPRSGTAAEIATPIVAAARAALARQA